MEYIDRELERKFLEMDRFFKAVLVIGARQVGKSTMLKQLAKQQHRTIVSITPSPAPWITSCPRPTSCAASNSLFCPRAPCQIHQKMAVATSNCNSLFLSPDAFRNVVDFLTFYDIIILQFGSPSF